MANSSSSAYLVHPGLHEKTINRQRDLQCLAREFVTFREPGVQPAEPGGGIKCLGATGPRIRCPPVGREDVINRLSHRLLKLRGPMQNYEVLVSPVTEFGAPYELPDRILGFLGLESVSRQIVRLQNLSEKFGSLPDTCRGNRPPRALFVGAKS